MLGILIEAFSQKEIVWTLPLGTLRYQEILLASVLNPPKEYQISYSTSIILTMVITEEFHICIWHLDSLWIMILLIFYILPVLLVDAELGIYFHLQIREQLFRSSHLEACSKWLNFFSKYSIITVWQGSKYASVSAPIVSTQSMSET